MFGGKLGETMVKCHTKIKKIKLHDVGVSLEDFWLYIWAEFWLLKGDLKYSAKSSTLKYLR